VASSSSSSSSAAEPPVAEPVDDLPESEAVSPPDLGNGDERTAADMVDEVTADEVEAEARAEAEAQAQGGAEDEDRMDEDEDRAETLVGKTVVKEFGGAPFIGQVVEYKAPEQDGPDEPLWGVQYEDGDAEDLDASELSAVLAAAASPSAPSSPAAAAAAA
jgi:hypothetical protein